MSEVRIVIHAWNKKYCPDCGAIVDYDNVNQTVTCGDCNQRVKLTYIGRAREVVERWREEKAE